MSRMESDERSLPQLLAEMTKEMGLLMRKEVELAKVETKEEVARAGKAGAMLGATAITGYLALLFLSFALAWGLDSVMTRWLAFALVGAIYAVAAAVLFNVGRKKLKEINPVPEQTVETLKEDVEWAKTRKN